MLLQVKRYTPGTVDAHNNATDAWGNPQPWDVRGIAPGSMDETLIDRDSSSVEWTVYADNSAQVPSERDLVVFLGNDYAVNGRPKDWTLGPWDNPTAGVVVELERVEG